MRSAAAAEQATALGRAAGSCSAGTAEPLAQNPVTFGMPAAAGGGEGAKRQPGLRARVCCVALAVYSFLLANGLAELQERVLSRG